MKPLGLALPSAHLLATAAEGGPPRLALGGPHLDHLFAFAAGLAAALPRFGDAALGLEGAAPGASSLSAELGAAADAGPPGEGGVEAPASVLGQVGAVVARLGASASEIAAAVAESGADAEGALRRIADLCLSLRRDVSPLIDRLDRVGAEGAAALTAVAEAHVRGAQALEALQEAGGRRRQKIRSLRDRAGAGGGLFGSSRGRAGPGEVAALEAEEEAGRRAEAALRSALAAVEPLHREAAWFGPAVRDARSFFATLRQSLTDVGSGVSQAQSDGRVGRGAGRPELEALLGGEAARARWSAIAGASRALADRLHARGGAPTKGRVP